MELYVGSGAGKSEARLCFDAACMCVKGLKRTIVVRCMKGGGRKELSLSW